MIQDRHLDIRIPHFLNRLADRVHEANGKWWVDIETGELKERNTGEILMLCASELAEALEGDRKDLQDDKLKHRKMFDVELVDCMIRLLDICGAAKIDIGQIFEEKMDYNAKRDDHKLESRKREHGKKY